MKLVISVLMLVPTLALAQPSGSGSVGSGSGSSEAPAPQPPPPAPPPTDPAPNAAARKACTDAMNADPTFAKEILKVRYQVEADKCDLADAVAAKRRLELDDAQHHKAAASIEKNQKHVIMAYAAMWIIAAGFVMFLWRRQQTLRNEIAGLKADLDAATKDGK